MSKIGNHRASFLDYHKPGIFMITMNKLHSIPKFSDIVGGAYNDKSRIYVRTTPMGRIIQRYIDNFNLICPNSEIYKYIIMPDHIHFLIYIKEKMDFTLGEYLAIFKRKIYTEAFQSGIIDNKTKTIFEIGFNDLFVNPKISLKTIKNYIQRNPERLWVRIKTPEYFSRVQEINIGEIKCSMYGNIGLLENPFCYPVVVHRKDSTQELEYKKDLWRYAIENGGVLTGAFISKPEKEVLEEIYAKDGKMILIKENAFNQREKPKGREFDLCKGGKLLIVSPQFPFTVGKDTFRRACLMMNAVAEKISNDSREGTGL